MILILAATLLAIRAALGQEQSAFESYLFYEQLPNQGGYINADGLRVTWADDFSFAAATKVSIVTWWGRDILPTPTDQFSLKIYSDDDDLPGPILLEFEAASVEKLFDSGRYRYSVNLPTSLAAEAGKRYWISIMNPPYDSWGWLLSDTTKDYGAAYSVDSGAWIRSADGNAAFALGIVPEPETTALLLVAIVLLLSFRLRTGQSQGSRQTITRRDFASRMPIS